MQGAMVKSGSSPEGFVWGPAAVPPPTAVRNPRSTMLFATTPSLVAQVAVHVLVHYGPMSLFVQLGSSWQHPTGPQDGGDHSQNPTI